MAGKNDIANYWKRGEGAARIRWGTPGDFTRCVNNLSDKVGSEPAKRMCAQWVKDTTGKWNAEQ